MISFEVNNNTCDPYISRPRRQRHDSGRHFDSNGPTERHLDIRGVLEILRKNENYTGGVNCAVCDDSSSSSSDESDDNDDGDDELLLHVCVALINRREIPRIRTYFDIVMHYDDQEFRRNFRLTRDTFNGIVDFLENTMRRRIYKGGREQISLERQVLITIWYFANTECYRSIASRFGVCESTVMKSVDDVVFAFLQDEKRFISWPKREQLGITEVGFRAFQGKLYKSRVCFIKHIWEHTVYWDEFDGAKNHERVLSIQAALILHTGFQVLTLEESNQLENLLVTSPNEKKESEYGSPDFKKRPRTPKKSPWKRKKSFEL